MHCPEECSERGHGEDACQRLPGKDVRPKLEGDEVHWRRMQDGGSTRCHCFERWVAVRFAAAVVDEHRHLSSSCDDHHHYDGFPSLLTVFVLPKVPCFPGHPPQSPHHLRHLQNCPKKKVCAAALRPQEVLVVQLLRQSL